MTSAFERAVRSVDMENGTAVVFSDCHYRRGQGRSTAHAALLRLIPDLKPRLVIANGDVLDFPRISRHPSIGWEQQPNVLEDLDAARERVGEIDALAGHARRFWPLGNHDMRFETRLATAAPEYCGVHGFSLKDHFPGHWEPCWRVDINPGLGQAGLIVQHRGDKGGVYGAKNNAISYGRSFAQGHLHAAGVFQITNANGTFYGVDNGCVMAIDGEQNINYTEGRPLNWRSGFGVYTFWRGHLLEPQLLTVVDEEKRLTQFRGEIRKEAE